MDYNIKIRENASREPSRSIEVFMGGIGGGSDPEFAVDQFVLIRLVDAVGQPYTLSLKKPEYVDQLIEGLTYARNRVFGGPK